MRRAFSLVCVTACLATVAALAQEGHPLTGTWSGDWGPSATDRTRLTFVMTWDGQKVTGTINPGPEAIPITSVGLDVTNWSVRIEADTRGASGNPIHIVAEGRLEDIGSIHRTITGTWRQGATAGAFKITRD